ncbi:helix-turn-helix domain-containing protein [Tsukamurella ocularis]
MHEYRRFIQAQLDERGWRPADLARKSGLSKQLISDVLKDDRDHLGRMPNPSTISALARGFGIAEETVRAAAARSLVDYSDDGTALTITLGEVSTDALLNEIRRRIDHADLSPAAAAPATSEDTQDEAREGQKTVVQVRTLADQLQYFADSAERTAQAAADLHELDPLAPPNPQLAYMLRKQVGFWQEQIDAASPEDRVTLQIELDRALRWISKFPSEQELKAKIRESETLAQAGNLAPDEGKPHDLRGAPAPADPTPDLRTAGAWPDGEPVGFSTYPRWLDWRNAGEPDDWEAYRRGVPNESRSTSTANSDGPDRWPDGEPVYNGDDRANWKSWRRAGEPADWETYRDGRQDDVELIGGPGAARDLGTEPMGRKIRRDQDKAAETPDEPA